MKKLKRLLWLCIAGLTLTACSDDSIPELVNQAEVITDVSLTFTNTQGVDTTYTYTAPLYRSTNYEVPIIKLQRGEMYEVSLHFYNKSNPDEVEDITQEVIMEKDDHFVEYRFSKVSVDLKRTDKAETTDSKGIQIGLFTQWTPTAPGQGSAQVTLIHKPLTKDTGNPNGEHTGGETDAQVTFGVHIH